MLQLRHPEVASRSEALEGSTADILKNRAVALRGSPLARLALQGDG
jgi:hypothetical protein